MGTVPEEAEAGRPSGSGAARQATIILDIAEDLSWHVRWADADARASLRLVDSGRGAAAFRGWIEGSDFTALQSSLRNRRSFTLRMPVHWNGNQRRESTVRFTPLERAGTGDENPGEETGLGRWLVSMRPQAQTSDLLSSGLDEAGLGLSLIAEISGILADAVSPRVLGEISQKLMRRLRGWAAFVVDGPTLQVADLLTPPARRRDLARLARRRSGDDPVLDLFLSTSMRSIRLEPSGEVPEDSLTGELLVVLEAEDAPREAPLWVFPVLGRQRVLGLLVFAPPGPGGANATVGNRKLATILELVARRVGMAMENAELYSREHRLAETLQRAMLPEQAEITDLDVWTYYAPNSGHAQVGGDWYDVLDQGDGRVGLVVGDVVGHDVEAAAAMGQLRSVVRAYAAEFADPGTVLDRVDRLVRGIRTPRPASLVYVSLAPVEEGEWEVSYGRAGHLPPVLVHEGIVQSLDDAAGALIGFGTQPRLSASARAYPGDVLVCYTDGLVERRDRSMRQGVADLVEICAALDTRDAAGVGEELLGRLADDPEDDIALVVVRIPDRVEPSGPQAGPRQRRWQLPAEPQTAVRARHALLRTCSAWRITQTPAAELVLSELVANAIMHGRGRVDLCLQDTGDGLRIEVEDANPAPPVMRDGSSGLAGGYGLHIVDRLADWGWRPSGTGKIVWARLRPGSSLQVTDGTSTSSTTTG